MNSPPRATHPLASTCARPASASPDRRDPAARGRSTPLHGKQQPTSAASNGGQAVAECMNGALAAHDQFQRVRASLVDDRWSREGRDGRRGRSADADFVKVTGTAVPDGLGDRRPSSALLHLFFAGFEHEPEDVPGSARCRDESRCAVQARRRARTRRCALARSGRGTPDRSDWRPGWPNRRDGPTATG